MYFNNDGTKKILKKTALISTGRFFFIFHKEHNAQMHHLTEVHTKN